MYSAASQTRPFPEKDRDEEEEEEEESGGGGQGSGGERRGDKEKDEEKRRRGRTSENLEFSVAMMSVIYLGKAMSLSTTTEPFLR